MPEHIPVLLNEVLTGLRIKPNGIYIDATFGRGGHTRAILEQLGNEGKIVAIDRDPSAILAGQQAIKDVRLQLVHAEFSELKRIAIEQKIVGQVDGILLDLGVSSPQLDDASRGFSFMNNGPLDMRMNPSAGESAADWLAKVEEKVLADSLFLYGEERFAKRIAKAIIDAREQQALTTTKQLAEVIAKANPKWEHHKHPATRSFQAIRIVVNDELGQIQQTLQHCAEVLTIGGRAAVISFHSLEDRIVKQFIQSQDKTKNLPRGLPLTKQQLAQHQANLQKVGKAIKPSVRELENNPRSRSAVLRIVEKI